jgi:alpha-beta hydrolase superfamily lysophospholipase
MNQSDGTATAYVSVGEIELQSADGTMLRGNWWRRAAPRGLVIISHGYGEHGAGYWRIADSLGKRLELDVVAIDYRGHGRSGGRRGVVLRYDELTEDLGCVIQWAGQRAPDLKRFLLGHSNGGQVALRATLRATGAIDGLMVSNPALRVAVSVPAAKLAIARVLGRIAPRVTLKGEIPTNQLTRDPEIQEEHRADRLRHNRMSPRLYFGMLEGGRMLLSRASEIRTPTLMMLGAQDPVIDPIVSREFFDRLGSEDKTLLIYPKMLHEPFNEVGRHQVVEDLVGWLAPRL